MQHRVLISDASAIGAARRLATQIAAEAGADETQAGRVSIVASELATNIARHARNGELLIQIVDASSWPAVELIAVDRGPGIQDVRRCLGDGYSTAGTAGNGLGAIQRLSALFDLYSVPGHGTVVVARIRLDSQRSGKLDGVKAQAVESGAICLAVHGEPVCGDAWRLTPAGQGFSVIVADGLGHGLLAHEASNAALDAFDSLPDSAPETVLQRAHDRMSSTRGGAVACARIDTSQGLIRYAGLGNICGSAINGTRGQGLVSHNGIVGGQARRMQAFEYPWSSEHLLVMHSDGLSARWHLGDYPGLVACHPAVIAGVLYRDHSRPRDDATVVVARQGRA